MIRYILCALFGTTLCGCASRECVHLRESALDRGQMPKALPLDPRDHVLVLSGGGSVGAAWCAGVFKGWAAHPLQPRPREFRHVTGVSAGGLLAPAAFLGDDTLMSSVVTSVRDADVYQWRPPWQWPFAPSLAATGPLEALLTRLYTDEIIDQVGREANRGRKCLVGSVDLDSGRLFVWDLTAIAGSKGEDRYVVFRKALLATSAIPLLFEPVDIGGRLHVDGGLKENFFLEECFGRMATPRDGAPPSVWLLMNVKPGISSTCVQPNLASIGLRCLEVMRYGLEEGNLLKVKAAAARLGLPLHMTAIPPQLPVDLPLHHFDPEKMRQIYQAGYDWGKFQNWELVR